MRLGWAGVPPRNLAAPVRYFSRAEGGVSHFHYLRDNATLVWMHTRLIAELLIDCAACRRSVLTADEQQAISDLRKAVRQREQKCVEALLKLFGFRPQDAAASDALASAGRW